MARPGKAVVVVGHGAPGREGVVVTKTRQLRSCDASTDVTCFTWSRMRSFLRAALPQPRRRPSRRLRREPRRLRQEGAARAAAGGGEHVRRTRRLVHRGGGSRTVLRRRL